MNFAALGVGSVLSDLIGRFFPDKSEAQKAQLELAAMIQRGEIDAALKQIETNIEEAKHPNVFVSGWRPFLGWCGGGALLYVTIARDLLAWVAAVKGWPVPPVPDVEAFVYILGILLGVGGTLRTAEKIKGVSR